MSRLKEIAKKETSVSRLMDGREKITTEHLIADYGTVSVSGVDMISTESGSYYPVIIFLENPDVFYCGGVVLKKIVSAWHKECGNIDEINEILQKDPVKMSFAMTKTKNNNNVVKVTIVD